MSYQSNGDIYSVRKRVSVVWRYFEKLDKISVRCKLCDHTQNYQGTTGNILRHLRNRHHIDATLKGQSAKPEFFSGNKLGERCDKNEESQQAKLQASKKEMAVNSENGRLSGNTSLRQSQQIARQRIRQSMLEQDSDSDLDPYAENCNAIEFIDYLQAENVTAEKQDYKSQKQDKQNYSKLIEENLETKQQKTKSTSSTKPKYNIFEERLRAEIEYFREKAAFYRMQRNVLSLQAKKLKLELNQTGS